ncbi:MAG TPA: hypothetical protein PKD00_00240 [Burkholderiales bacterium]|nr:hypothetical protein [Burkholderiales bacterium]
MNNAQLTIKLINVSDKNNNKYYDMINNGNGTFTVKFGRVGASPMTKNYPINRWDTIYREKINKNYKDITSNFKASNSEFLFKSDDIKEFYNIFSKNVNNVVSTNYLVDNVNKTVIDECKKLIKDLSYHNINLSNEVLLEIFKLIPRKMNNVNNFLVKDLKDINLIVERETDLLDTLSSKMNLQITESIDFCDFFNIEMNIVNNDEVNKFLNSTNNTSSKIYKLFSFKHKVTENNFDNWVKDQENKTTKLLIHGTKNGNIFNIFKTGLLIRPSTAVSFAGSAYGDGIYHSFHTSKSLGYADYSNNKLLLIQDVHLGNYYTYKGWFRESKDLSRNELNYNSLKNKGYDSLYVEAGDGLLNSEYIVYNAQQTTTKYLAWLQS